MPKNGGNPFAKSSSGKSGATMKEDEKKKDSKRKSKRSSGKKY
jgi:hypothetical protein